MAAALGTFEDLMGLTEPDLRPVAEALRSMILDVHPETVEVVRLGDRAVTYGVGPKKMTEGYCYILPHRNWVNLGFYQGSGLPDPGNRLEGTGARMRHVKVRSVAEASDRALRSLVEAALSERRSVLG